MAESEMLALITESGLTDLAVDSGLLSASGTLNRPPQPPPDTLPSPSRELKRRREDEREQIATAALVASSRGATRGEGRGSVSSGRRKVRAAKAGAKGGLRDLSLRVCRKVRRKGVTSYNDVASELVREIASAGGDEQKNIRRRVYDALNVLMAMDIIKREKKEIVWLGLPSSDAMATSQLRTRIAARHESIAQKERHLEELLTQVVTLHNLVGRNRQRRAKKSKGLDGRPVPEDDFVEGDDAEENRIYLPFVVVNTPSDTVIDCEMAYDRSEFFFNFSQPFCIHDDNEVLKRMGMGVGEARGVVPADLERWLPHGVGGRGIDLVEDESFEQ